MFDMSKRYKWFSNLWRFGMELGKPTFVLVKDLEMGFEKITKIAHSRGGNKIFSKLTYLNHELFSQ